MPKKLDEKPPKSFGNAAKFKYLGVTVSPNERIKKKYGERFPVFGSEECYPPKN
jgi:hypothetical protein